MRNLFISILPRAIVPAVVIVALKLFSKYFPATTNTPSGSEYSFEELDERFRSTKWVVGSSMIVVAILFAWTTQALLVWLNHFSAISQGTAEYVLYPQTAIWYFFPGFGALCLCGEITFQIWSFFGSRETANLYNDWSNQATKRKQGWDMNSLKVMRWLSLFVALPICVLTILELPVHVSLGEKEIRDCGYAFSRCKVYRYSDAQRLTQIDGFRSRDGKLTARAGLVVDFKDARRWSSGNIGDFQTTVNPELLELFEAKTQLPLNHLEAEEDIPALQR